MSVTVADFKHPGTPPGRTRFVYLVVANPNDNATREFMLIAHNGAKIAGHPASPPFGVAVTQHSNGKVLGIEASSDGIHFVVTAEDGGTFGYAFQK